MIRSQKPNTQCSVGGVAEWLNAPVLKTDVGESLPWVRIPPPPPFSPNSYVYLEKPYFIGVFWGGYQNGYQNGYQKLKISRRFLGFRLKRN